MRRAYADRALHLGDPEFDPGLDAVVARLTSKQHAAALRAGIDPERASASSPESYEWPPASPETTHLSVVDAERNAVSLTTTLEASYGGGITVPGAGFLLNNEMGDFNPVPGLTDASGRIGTEPNRAAGGKRMLSNMTPTILTRDGAPLLVIGTPGGRTIINTVLQIVVSVVDFGMNVQQAIDTPRIHHQWLPDELRHESQGVSPDTLELLAARGHRLKPTASQGSANGIVYDRQADLLEGGADRRSPDSAAIGY
jgi:gamma-glutamyltranspeptidase/glutathione hydrolase